MLVLMLGYMFVHVGNFVGEIAFEENRKHCSHYSLSLHTCARDITKDLKVYGFLQPSLNPTTTINTITSILCVSVTDIDE